MKVFCCQDLSFIRIALHDLNCLYLGVYLIVWKTSVQAALSCFGQENLLLFCLEWRKAVPAEKWTENGLTSCLLVKEYGFACKFNNGFVVNQKKALPLPLIFERGNIKSNLLIKTNLVLTILEWKI